MMLIISLIGNFMLGSIWLRRAIRSEITPIMAKPTSPISALPKAPRTSTDAEAWKQLSAHGDTDFVQELKAGGFPPEIIGLMVRERLDERFSASLKTLMAGRRIVPYWKNGYPFAHEPDDPNFLLQRRAHDREYNEAYEALVGNDPTLIPAAVQRRYGNLSLAKIQAIEAINVDYGDLRSQIRNKTQGIPFPEDAEEYALLDREKRADLEQALTPGEFANYDLRSSDTANKVRDRLQNFNPSEQEFKALYQVEKDFDQRYANATLTADESRNLREAQVQQVLTPDRFADYQVKTAGGYYGLLQLTNGLGLPESAVGDVIRLDRDVTSRANTIRGDLTLAPAARDAQLADLANEATTKLTTTLGQQGFSQYRLQAGWLMQLQPPASGAPKK